MLGNIGSILQQVATAISTGTIPIALGTIAIVVVGCGWAMGRLSFFTAAAVVLGLAIIGSAATIAPMLVSG